uniref:7TM_GPCR_Srx domain-containing protein n=1 Tax=Haemonchus placei TaxID=6290 RepID=A0A0N4WR44_HAEPC
LQITEPCFDAHCCSFCLVISFRQHVHVVPPSLHYSSNVVSKRATLRPLHCICFNIAIITHFQHPSCFWSKLSRFTLGFSLSNERSILIVFVDEHLPSFIRHSIIEVRARPSIRHSSGLRCGWFLSSRCRCSGSCWNRNVFWRYAKSLIFATNAIGAFAFGVSCAWISHFVDHPSRIIT